MNREVIKIPNKIVLLGKAGVGKTSIIDVFFKNINPEEVLNKSPSPTRGFINSSHNWLDLILGVFDTSGQEITDFLDDAMLQTSIFESADIILYFLDYKLWINEKDEIVSEILKINNILKDSFPNSKLKLIFHKVDLISYEISGIYDLISRNINNHLKLSESLKVYFTSIKPELVFSIYKTISEILSTLSTKAKKIQTYIIDILKKYEKTACFLTNESHNILVYSLTDDFNVSLLPQIYKSLELLSRTSKITLLNSSGVYLTDSNLNFLNFFIDTIKEQSVTFQKVILYSEVINSEDLNNLCIDIKESIRNL